jgi:hypothetical protein
MSCGPARLQTRQKLLSAVAHAILFELLLLARPLLGALRPPSPVRDIAQAGIDLIFSIAHAQLCLVVGDPPPIAQQVPIPVFAPADASLAGLERANKAFHVVTIVLQS